MKKMICLLLAVFLLAFSLLPMEVSAEPAGAPVIALTQTIDLINIVRGKPSGWSPQSRVRNGLAAADAMPRYYWHLGVGAALVVVSFLNPMLGAWLSPVTLGLLLAPWLAMETAKVRPGERLAKKGVFAVPGSRVAEPVRPLALA